MSNVGGRVGWGVPSAIKRSSNPIRGVLKKNKGFPNPTEGAPSVIRGSPGPMRGSLIELEGTPDRIWGSLNPMMGGGLGLFKQSPRLKIRGALI